MLTENREKPALSRREPQRKPAAMSAKMIYAIRLKNLKALIVERFEGKNARAAKAMGCSHTFMWQLVNRDRNIGEETARRVEQRLYLDAFALDRDVEGVLQRATKLQVREPSADGRVVFVSYSLVPEVELVRGLKKKTGRLRPCPIPCSEEAILVIVTSDSLAPLISRGQDVYIEQQDRKLVTHGVYALQVKGWKDPVLRIAELRDGGGWRFFVLNPGAGDPEVIDHKLVTKVYGKVFYKGEFVEYKPDVHKRRRRR